MKENLMWECSECGGVEYSGVPPEECEKCWSMNSFVRVQDDEIEDKRERKLAEGIKKDLDDEEGDE